KEIDPVLQMRHITKTFGSVTANRDVDLSVYPGEIHALLGENGAGKSTLMNILTGIYRPDGGEIWYKGQKRDIHSPKDAVALGIGMVHQHFRLIPTLTVAENVYLYSGKKSFFLNRDKMEKEIRECSEQYNLQVAPEAYVWQLSVGEQQRVEIIKLLNQGAEVLILDEPSAVLTPQEAQSMFDTLRKMADSGKAVIVISHKMNEVMKNADRITVLKNGRVEDTMPASEADVERLTRGIVGDRTLPEHDKEQPSSEEPAQAGQQASPEKPAQAGQQASPEEPEQGAQQTSPAMEEEKKHMCGEEIFFMEGVSAQNDRGLPALKKISLSVRAGEIFGIAGVAGNGQRELSEVIAGLRPVTEGRVLLAGKDLSKATVKQHIEEGIAFIPEDRLQTGLVPELTFTENIILKSYETDRYSRRGILQKQNMRSDAEEYAGRFDIRHGGLDLPVGLMSGGNQQKLLFAREVSGDPRLITATYPVRGLDIGAAESIRGILREQSRKGAAVIFISEELEEIFAMCDRVGVLCDGELMGIRTIGETDFQEIGRMMSGEREETK
ncbi:MAG: ATP-binding cassette domain-containing protein, partial [Lachnospiraceae bacterium]|nr:ATP-binding cassette domain-containing protein [Lachnospiraceae bacterium]